MTRLARSIGRDKVANLSWDNLPARLAPELKVDIEPNGWSTQYRRLFPAYTPEQVFFAATTAGRSWRGQVEEAVARARAGAPTWVYQLDFVSPSRAMARRASHTGHPARIRNARCARIDRRGRRCFA